MFTTIKLVSRHQKTQQFDAMLPVELTNEDIRNSKAYKEYYAFATGAAPPKTKASVRKTKSSSDTIVTPPTAAAGTRLSTSAKGKQPAKTSKAKSLTVLAEDDDDKDEGDDDDDQDEGNDEDQDSDEEGEEFIHPKLSIHDKEETKDEESFDPIAKTLENSDDEVPQAPTPLTTAPSTLLQDLPNFGSLFRFDHRLKTLKANFSEFIQTNQFARAVSSIPRIVQRYMDKRINEAVKLVLKVVLLCLTKRTMCHGRLVFSDDELSDKELKQIEADNQAIQTIHLGLPEYIYAAVDNCETAQEMWLRVQQMMKGSDIPEWSRHVTIVHQTKDLHTVDYTQLYDFLKYNQKEKDELKAKRLASQDPLALMANSNNSYAFPAPHQDQSSFNQNYLQ
nr:hypothetical protein [Tanacetum cinerariifolium]